MLLILLLLFPPVFSVPYLIIQRHRHGSVYNLKYLLQIYFFISVIAVYWFPWGDSQTHFSIYYSDIISRYYELSINNTHWLYDFVLKLIADLFGNYVYGYWFWIYFPFAIFLYAIYHDDSQISKRSLLVVLYLFLSVGIRELLDLNRNTSAAFLLISAILLFKSKRFISIFLIAVAFMLHSSIRYVLLVLPMGFLISKLSNIKLNFLSVIIPLCSFFIINYLAPFIVDDRTFNLYFSSDADATGVGSSLMRLITYINILIFYLNYFILNKNRNLIPKSYYNISLAIAFMVFFSFSHFVTRERSILIYNVFVICLLVRYGNQFVNPFKCCCKNIYLLYIKIFILKILVIFVLTFAARIVFNSASLNNSHEFSIVSRSCYVPTLLLLDIQQFGFSDDIFNKLYRRVQESNQ